MGPCAGVVLWWLVGSKSVCSDVFVGIWVLCKAEEVDAEADGAEVEVRELQSGGRLSSDNKRGWRWMEARPITWLRA